MCHIKQRGCGGELASAIVRDVDSARPARSAAAPPHWSPDVAAARQYLAHRGGNVSFAVRTERRVWGHHRLRVVPAASVLKAMLMVAYLNRREVRDRPLRERDLRLLRPMIRRSDNATASLIRNLVGNRGLRRLARRVGMRRFTPVAHPWGDSRVNAADQTRFFLHLDRFVPETAPAQGTAPAAARSSRRSDGASRGSHHRSWELYFKGGWGSGTGAVDHQVALLRRGPLCASSVAVMTTSNGSHAYGKATLRGVFRRLLRGLGGASSNRSGVKAALRGAADIARVKVYGPASSTAHQLRSTEMTQAPNDSLPSPAALARSLGYAFVVGGDRGARCSRSSRTPAETNETGILSLVALAYTVGLICLRAEDRLPTWATPAALALATILVTYAVEFFSDPTRERLGDLLRRRRPTGRLLPEPLVGSRRRWRSWPAAYGLVMWGHEGALELWLGHGRDGRARHLDGRDDARARAAADRPARRRRPHRRAHRACSTGAGSRRSRSSSSSARAAATVRSASSSSTSTASRTSTRSTAIPTSDRALKTRRRRAPGEQAADRRGGADQRRGVRPDRARHRRARRVRARRTGCGARCARRSPRAA